MTDPTRTATALDASAGEARAPRLLIVHHPAVRFAGSSYLLPDGDLTLGRDADTFVPGALDDSRTSRKHARIERRGELVSLTDLASRNGTFVNGRPITTAPLAPGDVIGIGNLLLLFDRIEPGHVPLRHPRVAGTSAALGAALAVIERAAEGATPVLVLGESGVGKELFAREVHLRSGRPGKLVTVNAAAIADGVVQSELFGHVRAAFSGADQPRRGLVEEARGGTLFLDEIGDASPTLQANLLRVVQEHEVRPVGSDRTVSVDVRFVAATNRPLAEDVRKGRFREDLYARLHRAVVRIPPLRERREDILPIARRALERLSGRPVALTQKLALALLLHDWPGNVRALEGLLERLLLEQGAEGALAVPAWFDDDLGFHARAEVDPARPAPAPERAPEDTDEAPTALAPRLRLSPDELRRRVVAHGGNVTTLAEELGVGRNTLYRWLKKTGIDLRALRRPS
jgi:transcriptional regulator with PAS, ATPase and Fis domain